MRPPALACGLALLAAFVTPAPPATADGPPPGRTLSAVYFEGQAQLDALGARHDVWEVRRDAGYAVVLLPDVRRDELVAAGYRVEKLADVLGVPQAKLDPRYFYYDDFVVNSNDRYYAEVLPTVADRYPELTELVDVGDSWEAGGGGHAREMWVLRITNEDPTFGPIEEKPAFFLMANIHGREVATPELALRYAAFLLPGYRGIGGYGRSGDATWLVDHHVVYLLVQQNPDGHARNEADTGAFWRKNTNDSAGDCGFFGTEGIDLNRNHSFLWGCCGGSSGSACSDTYRGSAPASEPETAAFQAYFASVMPDSNGPNGDDEIPPAAPADAPGIFITLHSYSDLVLWPWGFFDFGPPPNEAGLEAIGRKLALFNGYSPDGFLYTVDGTSDDWVYGKFGIAAFTFEVGSGGFGSCAGFFPDYRCLDGYAGRNFWAENLPAFLWAHKAAAKPYSLVHGPDAVGAEATLLGGRASVAVSATVADRRYGSDPTETIVAAEAFLDAPGEEGAGVPLAPADGSWSSSSEEVTGELDVAGLAPGLHYVLVRGQTAGGAWGPLSGALFEVR